jgi:hypothetical protein
MSGDFPRMAFPAESADYTRHPKGRGAEFFPKVEY